MLNVCLLTALLIASSLTAGGDPISPLSIDPPAPAGATSPALATEKATTVDKGHDILITWLEPGESGGRLRFARYSVGAWTQPITIAEGVSTLGTGDWPTLTVIDTQAVRRTLIARTGDVVARSGDAGRTWTRLPAPTLPFSSFAGADEGAYAFWQASGSDGSARLLGTRVLAGESTLDPNIAGGSGTSAAMTWDGPVVVYRDQGAQGSEGIALVRRQDAQWTEPLAVHFEQGLSVDRAMGSPRVTALKRQVAVAWHTQIKDRPRLLVAFSSDAGRTFGAPVEVDAKSNQGEPLGSVDVALDDNGQALILWTTVGSGSEAALNLARVSSDGQRGEALVLAQQRPSSEDLPQIVRVGDQVAVTWTAGIPSRLRMAALPLSGVPALGALRPVITAAAKTAKIAKKAYRGRGRVGDKLPDLDLLSLDRQTVPLESLQGQAVLLNFWATWCGPCIKEMPELASLYEEFGPKGLSMVGVSVDSADAYDRVRSFVAQRDLPFTIWLDPEMRLSDAFRIRSFPATFIVDRQGRIILRRNSAIEADDTEIQKAIRRVLSNPKSGEEGKPTKSAKASQQ